MGQESWHSLLQSQEVAIKVSAKLILSWMLEWGKVSFWTHLGCGKTLFPCDCITRTQLLTVGRSHPQVLEVGHKFLAFELPQYGCSLHQGLQNLLLCASKMEIHCYINIIYRWLPITSTILCCLEASLRFHFKGREPYKLPTWAPGGRNYWRSH